MIAGSVRAVVGLVLVATGAVDVTVKANRVAVRASLAPLYQVLDRLGREIGMKVVYEGSPPRQLVEVALEDRTPAEAVLAILEGQGLNYALQMDVNGATVDALLITGSASAGTPSQSSPQPTAPARRMNERVAEPSPEELMDAPAPEETESPADLPSGSGSPAENGSLENPGLPPPPSMTSPFSSSPFAPQSTLPTPAPPAPRPRPTPTPTP